MFGKIEVFCGETNGGKTERLLHEVQKVKGSRHLAQIFVFNPSAAVGKGILTSHGRNSSDAIIIPNAKEIQKRIDAGSMMIAIDDAHLSSNEELFPVCQELTELHDSRVIVAGRDLDFRSDPFISMALIMAQAEYVYKLHAICEVCGREASRTQRLIAGKPVSPNSQHLVSDPMVSFEARCRECYETLIEKPSQGKIGGKNES